MTAHWRAPASTRGLPSLVANHSLRSWPLLQEHIDYDLVESTNPAFGKAVVRVNVFRHHRQTVQVSELLEGTSWGCCAHGQLEELAALPPTLSPAPPSRPASLATQRLTPPRIFASLLGCAVHPAAAPRQAGPGGAAGHRRGGGHPAAAGQGHAGALPRLPVLHRWAAQLA